MANRALLAFDAAGNPVSLLYDDIFRSRKQAWQEAGTVFVGGCGFPQMLAQGPLDARFTILEMGFGLGINFLFAKNVWQKARQTAHTGWLNYVGVEAHPLSVDELRTALFALLGDHSADIEMLCERWPPCAPGLHRIEFQEQGVVLTLAFGEAHRVVPNLSLTADCFFLDGFSPAKNPEMWSPLLMQALARLARPGSRIASYSAAGAVRQALCHAGFHVERKQGHGGKRHRIEGWYIGAQPQTEASDDIFCTVHKQPDRTAAVGVAKASSQALLQPLHADLTQNPTPSHFLERKSPLATRYIPPSPPQPSVLVIGAGLAGIAVAEGFLRQSTCSVQVLEQTQTLGGCAAHQPLCLEHPSFSSQENLLSRLTRNAALLRISQRTNVEHAKSFVAPAAHSVAIGRLELSRDAAHWEKQRIALSAFPTEWLRVVDAQEASDIAGVSLCVGGIWCPSLRAWASVANGHFPENISVQRGICVNALRPIHNGWQALASDGTVLAQATILVLANGGDVSRLVPWATLPMQAFSGQSTYLPHRALAGKLRTVVSQRGYAVGMGKDILVGSTFIPGTGSGATDDGNRNNFFRVRPWLGLDKATPLRSGGFGVRYAAPDRRPYIGQLRRPPNSGEETSSLFVVSALGSRGLLWATLAGVLIPALVLGDPLPIERDLLCALSPERFSRQV